MTPENPVQPAVALEAVAWHQISIEDLYRVAMIQAVKILESHPGSPVWHGVAIGFMLVAIMSNIADTLYDLHREIERKERN